MFSKVMFGALLGVVVLTQIPYGTVEPWWKAVFICAVLGLFILRIIENPIQTNFNPLVLPLLALALFAFVQTQISADALQTRFFALQLLALAAFLALLYRYAATENRIRILVFVVIGIAIMSAIFGILRQTTQHEAGFLLPLLKPNQGFAQFINKNHFAYLMEMAFGLGIGLIFFQPSKQRVFYLALLVPISLGLLVSNSRGGILAMLAQVVVAALLLMKRSALRIAFAAVLIAGVFLTAAVSDLTLSAAAANEGASRSDIWRATLKLFAAHPLLGIGLGAYWIGITAHHDASGVLVPQEAHNDYLELLASGGLIGFSCGVWFVVSVVRLVRKNLWSNTGFVRAARIGALLGIAGVAIHSLLDFGLHLTSNAVVFLTLIMMVTTQIGKEKVVDLNRGQQ
ncbi:MAG TPA: O-antigen ligase family protein [Pyrinomonadaceae bacterium]|nr:O-antigen ligase family protein [Pyrinomonadaceae bacterium]